MTNLRRCPLLFVDMATILVPLIGFDQSFCLFVTIQNVKLILNNRNSLHQDFHKSFTVEQTVARLGVFSINADKR